MFTASTQQMQLAGYRLGGDEPYGAYTLIHYQGVHSYDCTLIGVYINIMRHLYI